MKVNDVITVSVPVTVYHPTQCKVLSTDPLQVVIEDNFSEDVFNSVNDGQLEEALENTYYVGLVFEPQLEDIYESNV